jgi:hypothetical protein
MAEVHRITPHAGGETAFRINGTYPFQDETPEEYICAAHAVACLGAGNTGDKDEFYSADNVIRAGFDAIALLLDHAVRLLEKESN